MRPAANCDANEAHCPSPRTVAAMCTADQMAGTVAGGLLRRMGDPVGCLANVVFILNNDPAWSGVLEFDLASGRVSKRRPIPGHLPTPAGEWTSTDTSVVRIWLAMNYQVSASRRDVDDAVDLVARAAGSGRDHDQAGARGKASARHG